MSLLTRVLPRGLVGLAAIAVAAALLACSGNGVEPQPRGSASESNSTVTLMNDGSVALQNVRVLTSANDVLVLATLNPGQTAGPYPISVMHSSPSAQATAQGRLVAAIPVEGFDGFNPPRPAGAYVIRLRVGSEPGFLDIRVSPPIP